MRHGQLPHRRDVTLRVVAMHDQAAAVVVDGIDLAPDRIERDAGDEPEADLAADDVMARIGRGLLLVRRP